MTRIVSHDGNSFNGIKSCFGCLQKLLYIFSSLIKRNFPSWSKIVASTKFLDQDEDSLKTRGLLPSLKLFQNTWKQPSF